MEAILHQLELDQTFFIQLGIFAVLFLLLRSVYFRPFLKLIEARRKRTVEDREAAEDLAAQAQSRLAEYKAKINDERLKARQEYELILSEALKEEAVLVNKARTEAKKVVQEAVESATKQKEELTKQLHAEVEGFAKSVADKLLARRN